MFAFTLYDSAINFYITLSQDSEITAIIKFMKTIFKVITANTQINQESTTNPFPKLWKSSTQKSPDEILKAIRKYANLFMPLYSSISQALKMTKKSIPNRIMKIKKKNKKYFRSLNTLDSIQTKKLKPSQILKKNNKENQNNSTHNQNILFFKL
ncbi:UNKNOWN [Stylonychia lemnae]|uniref:Uncharacterized protein n=1 Tax=Stylonychia lemnae TaxID=5949 RepID=A0A078AFJ9_STYLE|nr:UNKNOWN [Stylonychia lemnae]|eukprot:CDW80611.1 UNKNOWN [Stylonychia lemnae]